MKQLLLCASLTLSCLSSCAPAPSDNETTGQEVAVDSSPPPTVSKPVGDGPFGIDMGQSPKSLDVKPLKAGWFTVVSPPKPHQFFPEVIVQATDSNGVCFVKGVSETVQTDRHGALAMSEAEKIKSQLDRKYGQADETAYLMPGTLWDEPEDWTMGLLKKERFQYWEWKQKNNSAAWKNLNSISLLINAASTDVVVISVEYYFKNSSICDEELEKGEAEAL